MYIVAVTGGRVYSNAEHVWRVLDQIHKRIPIDVLVQGGIQGSKLK